MATHAIGDLQGCLHPLKELLGKLQFSADRDQLWFCGDLINRGPDSLGTLRFVHGLRDNARIVLGNHDLHLLAVASACHPVKKGDTLDDILHAPDRDILLEWLLQQPLAIQQDQWLMTHAGVPPGWRAEDALRASAEVSLQLQRDPRQFFSEMYGNEPSRWQPDLQGSERLRYSVNALTRMRFVSADGALELKQKGAPGSQPPTLMPWYRHPDRPAADHEILFGHWATLNGKADTAGVHALDTGCVYGQHLTALTLETRVRTQVHGWQR
ncbi:symmetrical bis(5'-nucleosyl)-tetraphosphatase [Permianibacter sp. IMCC34836]|uniref:symmetrical bis(5'-nucleosyl)-tetraphosphatase n=1 Tax=Permianibacter fluminis TaxID=2738515 RepID=UPI001554CC66|nr:symmetrical bis(5'-nucleosyl)-tetraphosphatase [Permianibacter fluminis]